MSALEGSRELRPFTVYRAAVLTLVLCIGVLVIKVTTLSRRLSIDLSGAEPSEALKLLDRTLPTSDGTSIALGRTGSRYVLFYIFTAGDCFACLPELEFLDKLRELRSDISVVAIMGQTDVAEAAQIKREFHLAIPIAIDADGSVGRSLRAPKTPWKLVFDTRRKRLVYQDWPSINETQRQAALERLVHLGS